ncbi:unnamed protein product [Urochloa decumbens]|uniref:Uncharacterized protein n=1 Tax=Urochloa decumbens TaxID=240449 RepID=A0ABC8ZJP8_9POAL
MGVSTTDLSAPNRSVNLPGPGCIAMASPSPSSSATAWSRADKHRGGAAAVVRRAQLVLSRDNAGWCGLRAWRRLLRRLAQETKCICASPTAATGRPITFGYDAASYAKNFDDGRNPAPRCSAPVVAAAANAVDNSSGN